MHAYDTYTYNSVRVQYTEFELNIMFMVLLMVGFLLSLSHQIRYAYTMVGVIADKFFFFHNMMQWEGRMENWKKEIKCMDVLGWNNKDDG